MNITEFIGNLFHQPYFVCFLAIFACFCFYFLKDNQNKSYIKILWVAYALLFIVSIAIFTFKTIHRYRDPQVWDFGCWYLYGKTAAQGYNFYLPENFSKVFSAIHHTMPDLDYSGFIDSVVNVGFPYPPPTILYFIPLGFFSYKTAYILWTLFTMIFVLADIYLIYSLFLRSYKLKGLFLVSILFFIFLPTPSTIFFSQTNFFVLFYLLLMVKYQNSKYAGLFLTLAVLTKPYMIILILFFLLRKNWKVIVYFIMSSVLLNALMFILFGKEIFISYLFNNPASRVPAKVLSENVNQSLNAVLLRHKLISLAHPMAYVYIITGILLLMGIFLWFLLKRKLYDYILPALLLIGLLIYPGTLSHYGLLLLFIIFQFFEEKTQLGFSPGLNILIVAIFYYLSVVSIFTAICFLIFLLIFKSIFLDDSVRAKSQFLQNHPF